MLCLISEQLAAGESGVDWWQPYFEAGMSYLHQAAFDSAEVQFQKILNIDKNVPQAYYGLGVLNQLKHPGSSKALRLLEKTIRMDRDYAEAYYQLAQVYKYRINKLLKVREYLQKAVKKDPTMAQAWYELARVEEKLWPTGNILESYANAVRQHPENKKLYDQFINATLWHSRGREAIPLLKTLIKEYPDNPYFLLDLASIYYLRDQFEKSLKVLDTLDFKFPSQLISRKNLVRAKVYFATKRDKEGYEAYQMALDNISDSIDAKAFFDDLYYIMKDDEFLELRRTPLDSLSTFYRRFWRSRDPNLATEESERIPEHYNRLAYARKHFRRFLRNPDKIYLFYHFEHPYSSFNLQGEELLSQAHLPESFPKERDLDDIGIIYVRHGPPDQQVTSLNGLPDYLNVGMTDVVRRKRNNVFGEVFTFRLPKPYLGENLFTERFFEALPMNWSWKYFRRPGRPEMIFHFKKYGDNLGWIIEAIPYAVAEREVFDPRYRELGLASFNDSPNGGLVAELCSVLEEENKSYVKTGMLTETTSYRFSEKPLDFPWQILSFKGKDGKNLLELYYLIEGKQTVLDTTNQLDYLKLQKFVGFFTKKWDPVIRIRKDDDIPLHYKSKEWKEISIVDVERFYLPAGQYNFEIQVKDRMANKMGVYRGQYIVPNYHQNRLMMSDILLSGELKKTGNGDKFTKAGLNYTPHMFSPFQSEIVAGIYFEIYNLTLNEKGKTNFKITSTLRPAGDNNGSIIKAFFRSLVSKQQNSISTDFNYSGNTSDEKIFLNFKIEDQTPGKYELVIEVHDLNSHSKTSKKVSITII